jgi:hypothetical protein
MLALLASAVAVGCSGTAYTGGDAEVPGSDAALTDASQHGDAVVQDAVASDARTEPDGTLADAAPPDAATGCPANSAEHVEMWWTNPWVAPTSGDAEQVIQLSTQNQLHFSRAVISFEMETAEIQGDWTHIFVLRNRAIPASWPYLAYYGWFLSKNLPTRQIQVALNGCQNGTPYTLQPYTTYGVTYDYDAIAGTATITLDVPGGGTVSVSCPTASSSLVPIGQGLHLYMGMRTSHPDFPIVLPPWGWTFRNFVADLTPGGPYGPDAPPCP